MLLLPGITTAAGFYSAVWHNYHSCRTSSVGIDEANGVTVAGIYSVADHRRQAYSPALLHYMRLLMGVPAADSYDLSMTGVAGAPTAPYPCRWLRREGRCRMALCVSRALEAEQRPLAPYYRQSAAAAKSLAKGGRGTAGGAPSGGGRPAALCGWFCVVAMQTGERPECRAAKRGQKP